ncbi:MAG: HEPN domain-containing protein [Bacilli bacterium]|nr:HEPN domain-containing protein [Bacilli bacterium]
MKYDFSKIKNVVVGFITELNRSIDSVPLEYQTNSMKEYELSKVTSKLIDYLNSNEEFKGLLENRMIVTATMASGLSNYEVAKQIICNTIENGFENTVKKLDSFFNYNTTKFNSYYTLLGIKVKTEYLIDDNFKVIPYNETDLSFEAFDYLPTQKKFKNQIVNELFKTDAALVYTDNITLEAGNEFVFEKSSLGISEKLNKIVLLISLLSKKGCSILSNYCEFENESLITSPQSLGFSYCKFVPQVKNDVDLDVDLLKEMLLGIDKLDSTNSRHLLFIMSKFSDACLRNDHLGVAVELRTIIEALFGNDKDHNEPISHTVSYRGGYFLGDSQSDKLEMYKFLKKSYSISSRIVHGRYELKEGDYEIIDKLKNTCSDAIIKFIQIGRFYSKEDWDKITFGISVN